jgi:hypothetical protein
VWRSISQTELIYGLIYDGRSDIKPDPERRSEINCTMFDSVQSIFVNSTMNAIDYSKLVLATIERYNKDCPYVKLRVDFHNWSSSLCLPLDFFIQLHSLHYLGARCGIRVIGWGNRTILIYRWFYNCIHSNQSSNWFIDSIY